MANTVSWVEIPVTDFERATEFYELILGNKLTVMDIPLQGPSEGKAEPVMGKMGMFPSTEDTDAGCAIVAGNGYEISGEKGPVVYLNGGNDLQAILDKVNDAGGKVMLTKSSIGDNGYMAVFLDTEGNRIALHSPH